MPRRTSSVCGREFGNGVRAVLERAGLTGVAACEMVGWDPAKLSDLVNGKGGSTEAEVTLLLGLCRTPLAEINRLLALFRESREKGYLQFPESGLPEQVRTLIEHEKLASGITAWCMNLIPGLLQTPAYIRAVAESSALVMDVDAVVEARMARRAVIGSGREFVFYIHEQALRLPMGGAEVMSEQLHHLLRMSVRPYLSVRVVLTEMGGHAGAAGSFTQLKFAKYEPVVFVESHAAGLFLEDAASLAIYRNVLASLDRTALDEEQSRAVITTIAT